MAAATSESRAAAIGEFVFWWFCVAVLLAILLSLSATRFRTVHIHNVRLFGFFCWLAISWAGLLASYLFSWTISYFWYLGCKLVFDEEESYDSIFVDIRHSTMLLAWGFICWSTIPLLCRVDRHQCATGWVRIFHKAMLAALVVDIVYFIKDFLLELLFQRAASEFINPRKKTFKNITAALQLFTLGPKPPGTSSVLAILPKIAKSCSEWWAWIFYVWMPLMRRWSNPGKQTLIEAEYEQLGPPDFEGKNSAYLKSDKAAGRAFNNLSFGEANSIDYWIAAHYMKSLMPNCGIQDSLVESPSTKAQSRRWGYKILRCCKSFFTKHPLGELLEDLDDINDCIHEQVRSCGCRIDSHSQTSAEDKSCQVEGVSHLKSRSTDELHEPAAIPKTQAQDELCNGSCQCQGSCQKIRRGGWCKRQAARHVRRLVSVPYHPVASKAIANFESFEELWTVLDRNGDGFASFEELAWLVEDVGESLKEVVSGQKNLKMVVRDLNFVLSIALLVPVALTYGTSHTSLLHCSILT